MNTVCPIMRVKKQGCYRSGNDEGKNSMSGKSQGILLSHGKFEEKSRKSEIIWHSWFNTIEGWKKLLGHCDQCQWYFFP